MPTPYQWTDRGPRAGQEQYCTEGPSRFRTGCAFPELPRWYTVPRVSRERLGALLVGHYDGNQLRYAGKVGIVYDRRTLQLLHERLAPLHRVTSPFSEGPVPRGDIQWVTRKLVAEIGFSEWTSAGLLRHPRFLGLREDKPAREVRRE